MKMTNYYKIEILIRDVDDCVLTQEECEKISNDLIDKINKMFGFDFYDDNRAGEVLSLEIKGGNFGDK